MRLWRDGAHCRQRSRSAMNSIRRGPQQPETIARSKNFAGRQNCVRAGSTGSSMAWAPEASRQADDIRPQEPYAPASSRNTASGFELRFAILNYYMRESSREGMARGARENDTSVKISSSRDGRIGRRVGLRILLIAPVTPCGILRNRP
jgi:hypothetical protein